MDWTVAGVIATGIGVVITALGVIAAFVRFSIESRRARLAAEESSRRLAVARIIDAMEASVRINARFWPSAKAERGSLELVIAIPRLLLELSPDDDAVALWLVRQLQLMQLSPSTRDTTKFSIRTATTLIDWHKRRVPLEWFADQIENDPPKVDFRTPLPVTLRRRAREGWDIFVKVFFAGAIVVAAWTGLKEALK